MNAGVLIAWSFRECALTQVALPRMVPNSLMEAGHASGRMIPICMWMLSSCTARTNAACIPRYAGERLSQLKSASCLTSTLFHVQRHLISALTCRSDYVQDPKPESHQLMDKIDLVSRCSTTSETSHGLLNSPGLAFSALCEVSKG